jgi:hypothetical protein
LNAEPGAVLAWPGVLGAVLLPQDWLGWPVDPPLWGLAAKVPLAEVRSKETLSVKAAIGYFIFLSCFWRWPYNIVRVSHGEARRVTESRLHLFLFLPPKKQQDHGKIPRPCGAKMSQPDDCDLGPPIGRLSAAGALVACAAAGRASAGILPARC